MCYLGFTSVSSVTSVFDLQKIVYQARSLRRYPPSGACDSAQQIARRSLFPQRPCAHHRREQDMRRRMLAPVLQQLIGLAQREEFDFGNGPPGGGCDVAEEMRPVGDPA